MDCCQLQVNEWFVSDELIQNGKVGPGDEVFTIGLFSKMSGKGRNFPIVRTGNIAMMPSEPIPGINISDWTGEAEVNFPTFCGRG
jgi:hypothetical protein